MDYERSGNVLHDDIAARLSDLEDRMQADKVRMLPTDALHGFITAITIGPRLIVPSVWMPRIFFEESELPEFKDEKEGQRVVHDILNIYNKILKTTNTGIFSPLITVKKLDNKEEEILSRWCSGFLSGTFVFDIDEWDITGNPDLAELCLPIVFHTKFKILHEIYTDEQFKYMETHSEESGEMLIDAVYDIRDYFNPVQEPPLQIPEEKTRPKTGRNKPCPCGSGKKYKKCCGKTV